jgi:integrase
MSLTDTAVRNAKPQAKPYKLADEKGLYLLVHPRGAKYWRFKYRYLGKEKLLALGVYPDLSLKDARQRRDDARKLVAADIDPGAHRKAVQAARSLNAASGFEAVAREWHTKHAPNWSASHADKILRRFECDVFPWIGARPVADIMPPELLAVVRRIEARGALDTAHRALQNAGQVFRYAIATGRASRDPSGDLRGALPPAKGSHFPSITEPKAIGHLLRAIQGYQGSHVTRYALQLAPLVFVRPGELRQAEWCEFDLEAAEWRIPPARMKKRKLHIIPLPIQAVAILRDLQPLTGRGRYVFPGARSHERPMSENTVNAALRRLGYSRSEMTGHGFRSMASTILNEQGWNRDAIERQLAHAERDGVRAAYNYAEHLPERRRMMQAWANFLDELTADAKVMPMSRDRG